MKKFAHIFIFLLHGLALFPQQNVPRIDGFFVQPQLNYGAPNGGAQFGTQTYYDDWVKTMKDIGCTKLIFQFSAQYQNNIQWYVEAYPGSYPADFAWYHPTEPVEEIENISIRSWTKPTNWFWAEPGNPSPVDLLMNACEKHGIKLWLGLYLSESGPYRWWDAASFNEMGDAELATIDYHTKRSISMLNDLNSQYGDREGLAGYYISVEIANNGIEHEKNREAYKDMIDQISAVAHEKGKKISISPFFNPEIATGTPDLVYETWDYILKDSPLDIVMLQDGVGLRPELLSTTQTQIDPWFKAMKKACENNGKEFWANLESYYNHGTPNALNNGPTTFDKFRLQMEAESQYADVLVSFSYWTFDPTADLTAPNPDDRKALYDAYKNYYETEVKDVTPAKHEAAEIPAMKERDVFSLFSTKYGTMEGLDFSAVILNKITDTNDKEIRQVKGATLEVDLGDGISGAGLIHKTNLYMAIYPTETKNLVIDVYDSVLGKIDDLTIPTLVPNQWNELDIPLGDFFKYYSGTINKLVVRTTDSSATSVYFDHLLFYADPSPITFPDDPTHLPANVISLYGDSYVPVSNLSILPEAGTGISFFPITVEGETRTCIKLDPMGALNITRSDDSVFDLSKMDNFYMDVWNPNDLDIQFSLSWEVNGLAALTQTINSSEDWQSVLVSLKSIDPQDLAKIKMITISNASGTPGLLYFDNALFYRVALTAPIKPADDPQHDSNSVIPIYGYYNTSEIIRTPEAGTTEAILGFQSPYAGEVCLRLSDFGGVTFTNLSGTFNLSDVKSLTFAVWNKDIENIDIVLSWGTEDSDKSVVTKPLVVSEEWQYFTIQLSDFAGLTEHLGDIRSISIKNNDSSDQGVIFFDNIYFYKASLRWTGSEDSDWKNPKNWYPEGTPDNYTLVYLPGKGVDNYPVLSGNKADNICEDIYFAYGSQLGRSDLLTYKKAHVQLNFGLQDSQNPQIKEDNKDKPLRYAAYHAAKPIVRSKWHMMSNPLKKTVTGDYSLGGYTGTFLRKFDASSSKTGSALSANWTDFYIATNVELRAGEGFILWMNDFRSAFPYLEYGIENGREFGLQQLNGILELPYYEDEAMSRAHRIHEYEAENHRSVFRRFDKETGDLSNQIDYYDRGDQDEAYRFIFEQEGSESASVSYRVFMPEEGEGRFALLGNPYMSAIDFDKFYEDNKNYIDPSYQVWTGDSFSTYSVSTGEGSGSTETGVNQLISPMQSFLVQLKEGAIPLEGMELTFKIENITPAVLDSSSVIKSMERGRVDELLSITAKNSTGSIRTFVARSESGSAIFNNMETPKLLSSVRKVPDFYFLKPLEPDSPKMLGISYSIIGKESVKLPIALATTTKGENSFTFTGMNSYVDTEIIFLDKETGHQKDISDMEKYEYSFNYTPLTSTGGQVIPNEERFSLLINASPTNLEELTDESNIWIYNNKNGFIEISSSEKDPLQSIYLYDVLGRILYKKNDIGSSIHEISIANIPHSYVIVQVITKNGIKKAEKINVQ